MRFSHATGGLTLLVGAGRAGLAIAQDSDAVEFFKNNKGDLRHGHFRRLSSSDSDDEQCGFTGALKPMEECCPCLDPEFCAILMCHIPEVDCLEAAYFWPIQAGCPYELGYFFRYDPDPFFQRLLVSNVWMDDLQFCSYSEDSNSPDPAGDRTLEEKCDEAFGLGCAARRRLTEAGEDFTHRRVVTEHEHGVTVDVESDHEERFDWITSHVAEMKERMDSGEVTREWDPLFRAYFENVNDIKLECQNDEGNLHCESTSMSACGIDLIKAHAFYHEEIATSMKENGTHEVWKKHDVPNSCK